MEIHCRLEPVGITITVRADERATVRHITRMIEDMYPITCYECTESGDTSVSQLPSDPMGVRKICYELKKPPVLKLKTNECRSSCKYKCYCDASYQYEVEGLMAYRYLQGVKPLHNYPMSQLLRMRGRPSSYELPNPWCLRRNADPEVSRKAAALMVIGGYTAYTPEVEYAIYMSDGDAIRAIRMLEALKGRV